MDLMLKAEEGDDVTVDATAFVPEEERAGPNRLTFPEPVVYSI